MKTRSYLKNESRRKFLEDAAFLGLGMPLIPGFLINPRTLRKESGNAAISSISVFSKPVQFLSYEETSDLAAEIGFDGIDYAVRPEGHILPEKVADDLPKAVEAAKSAGLNLRTMTTAITGISDPSAEKILSTAAKLGIRYYRMGWIEYDHSKSLIDNLESFIPRFRALAGLNKRYGITGDYQNHEGAHLGSPVWDIYHILKMLEPAWTGCQYDIRHATCEGANSWPLGLELVCPYIHTLVIKDFYWRKIQGKWKTFNSPLGEGMVDFPAYFKFLRNSGISADITMHYEYALTDQPDSMLPTVQAISQIKSKMKKDLDTLKNYLSEASIEYRN